MKGTLRILCVEDREDDAQLVLRELRRAGYTLQHVRVDTAARLQQELRTGAWDAIVSDYAMPQFNAVAALQTLQASGKDLPFIIVSGIVGEDTAVAALKAGAHDFIPKGNLRRLVPALERELREAQGRRERRRAEEDLRRSTDTITAIFEASPLPIMILDHDSHVVSWNPAAERVFGWSAHEIIGRRLPITPDHDAEDHAHHLKRVLNGELISGEEVVRLRKDGTPLRLLVSAAPLRDADGTISRAMLLVTDITAQRELEEQFRQAHKMEAVGRLAGGIAHDFNNVLTAIQGYATLLLADIPEDDSRHGDAAEILAAAERAASFTLQLLAFSRKQVVQRVAVDLAAVVSDLYRLLDRMLNDNLQLRLDLSPGALPVLADRSQLEQVLINLVVNAGDAMAAGGQIVVRMRRAPVTVEEASTHQVKPGSYIVIEVEDTGAGISADVLEHIFEPFYTTKEVGKGTGLGLSTVYGIVRQNAGFVRVRSAIASGTTFSIFLPELLTAVPALPREKARIAVPVSAPECVSVLVVEDEVQIRNVIRRVLERSNYRVTIAADPGEALERLANEDSIDLLLTDILLPGMSGLELARAALALRPNLRIMYMSGYTEAEMSIDGDPTYLEKPFTPQELVVKVREALGRT